MVKKSSKKSFFNLNFCIQIIDNTKYSIILISRTQCFKKITNQPPSKMTLENLESIADKIACLAHGQPVFHLEYLIWVPKPVRSDS